MKVVWLNAPSAVSMVLFQIIMSMPANGDISGGKKH